MESSIAAFLMWWLACEPLPTANIGGSLYCGCVLSVLWLLLTVLMLLLLRFALIRSGMLRLALAPSGLFWFAVGRSG